MTNLRTITLSRDDYHDLVDARDHESAMRHVESGVLGTIDAAELATRLGLRAGTTKPNLYPINGIDAATEGSED